MEEWEDELPEDPTGDEIVLRALHELTPPIEVSDEIAADLDLLAEVLIDAKARFDTTDFLYLITALLVEDFDILVRDRCESEHLLLNAFKVAEDCVVRVYSGVMNRTRRRPYSSWKYQIASISVESCRWDPSMAANQEHDGSMLGKTDAALAVTLNNLERDARRVAWLSWVEYRTLDEIVRSTGFPLERIEWLLDRAIRSVRVACGLPSETKRETIRDEDINKWLEGGESERGE